MYLNKLSTEQKELFLDLSIHAAKANNEFSEEEKLYIEQYCDEMQISPVRYESVNDFDSAVDKIIAVSTPIELKIVVLELTALMLADNNYDELEKNFMAKMLSKTGLGNEEHDKMVKLLNSLSGIYSDINKLIFN